MLLLGLLVMGPSFQTMNWWCLEVILFLLVARSAGQFKVSTSREPTVATVGGDVVLECQLAPAEAPKDMEVRWFRSDWSQVVHLYRNGKDEPNAQLKQYVGRTDLFKDMFKNGNVSLLLKKVTVQDGGQYKCFVVSKAEDQEGSLQLNVGSVGRQPVLKVMDYEGSGIKLSCISENWFPKPHVEWRNSEGKSIKGHKETAVPDSTGLLRVESTITVSPETPTRYSCVITNQLLGREQEGIVEISDVFFPRTSSWLWAFIFMFVLLVISIAVLFLFYRRKRQQHKKMKGLMMRPTIKEYEALHDKLVQEETRAQLEKKNLLEEMEKEQLAAKSEYAKLLHSIEWDKMLRCAVTVQLDPETANGNLEVSEDGTVVCDAGGWRNVTESIKRFERYPFIMGTDSFVAGKHYWEVTVDKCPNWDVGVARESVDRKDRITLCPEQGYWSFGYCWEKYEVKGMVNTDLGLKEKLVRIGIFLNYDKGVVSFHNAVSKQQLHAFQATFDEPIYPFFSPWRSKEPLQITPVELEE